MSIRRPDHKPKRARTDDMEPASSTSAEGDLCYVLGLDNAILKSFLDEVDLIRLMSVNKSTRKIAAPELNRLETDVAETRSHGEMFRRFLRQPKIYREVMSRSTGTLRGAAIQVNAGEIQKRVAILHYERFYGHEESTVAIFNGRGVYVGIYRFQSYRYDCAPDDLHFIPMFNIWSSGTPPASWELGNVTGEVTLEMLERVIAEEPSDSKWRTMHNPSLKIGQIWEGRFLTVHYALLESFKEILLSPDEAVFVLMHALSSHTSNIVAHTTWHRSDVDQLLAGWSDGEYDGACEEEGYNPRVVGFWFRKCREISETVSSHELMESSAEGVLCSVLELDSTKSLLDEVDLIRLMSASRATRRVAAPELNRLENNVAETWSHAEMFLRFLRHPNIYRELYSTALRGATVQLNAGEIQKRVAILRYERFYGHEESTVAIFNGHGVYVGIYRFQSGRHDCDSEAVEFIPKFNIWSSGTPPASWELGNVTSEVTLGMLERVMAEEPSDSKWRTLHNSNLKCDEYNEKWDGKFLTAHYALFESFKEILLSPYEAVFVLMHALSSHTSNIVAYTTWHGHVVGSLLGGIECRCEDEGYDHRVIGFWFRKCCEVSETDSSYELMETDRSLE